VLRVATAGVTAAVGVDGAAVEVGHGDAGSLGEVEHSRWQPAKADGPPSPVADGDVSSR
jgi:hypothetical protein